MGAMVAKQPNGLLCVFSSVVDNITEYNLTEEEYIELRAEEAREAARRTLKYNVRPFEMVTEVMESSIELGHVNMTMDEWKKLLHTMSIEKERKE